jgi:hypothetical protein
MDSISARDRYGRTTNVVNQCFCLPHKLLQGHAQSPSTSVAYLAYNLRLGNKVSVHCVLVSARERITDENLS